MNDKHSDKTTGRLTPCLRKKIDKKIYLVEVHFSDTSPQSVEDKLKRVILHDLEHGKQSKPRKSDGNTSLTSSNRGAQFGIIVIFLPIGIIAYAYAICFPQNTLFCICLPLLKRHGGLIISSILKLYKKFYTKLIKLAHKLT